MSFWKKLFASAQPQAQQGPKAPPPGQSQEPASAEPAEAPKATREISLVTAELQAGAGEISNDETLELEICLQTDPGSVRTNNEDRCFYKRPADPALAAAKGTLVIVADGMGGASAGEIASEMAIRTIPELYYNSSKPPAQALKEALEGASAEIHRTAQTDPELHGMGTTCVAVAIVTPEVFVAYVGDSRLYLLRDGGFYQLTEDHTVVGEMVRKGILTREQARHHEERNVLSLSMGGRPEIQASFLGKPMVLCAGDRLLLCSDGLHDLITDLEMQAIISGASAHDAVQQLIQAAKREGGHDNITAALVHAHVKKSSESDCRATRELSISSA
jgi:PPM family protein phosphatase